MRDECLDTYSDYVEKILANVENKDSQLKLLKDKPVLANAIAFYEMVEAPLSKDGTLNDADPNKLIINNNELANPLHLYETLEHLFYKDDKLDSQDVKVLEMAVTIIGKQIRLRGPESVHIQWSDNIKNNVTTIKLYWICK